jgi:predicted enzyme related to lactoylglutathione lyase
MKRFHVNLTVKDLDRSVAFYTTLFDTEPTVLKPDYAKWMLDDPRVNFALSTRQAGPAGISHLGIQAESDEELNAVFDRLAATGGAIIEEAEANCCYAQSTKQWVSDPQGVPWETFMTRGELTQYGDHDIVR